MTFLPAVDEPIVELALPDGDICTNDDIDVTSGRTFSFNVSTDTNLDFTEFGVHCIQIDTAVCHADGTTIVDL